MVSQAGLEPAMSTEDVIIHFKNKLADMLKEKDYLSILPNNIDLAQKE